jgi:hypothetical protein
MIQINRKMQINNQINYSNLAFDIQFNQNTLHRKFFDLYIFP